MTSDIVGYVKIARHSYIKECSTSVETTARAVSYDMATVGPLVNAIIVLVVS